MGRCQPGHLLRSPQILMFYSVKVIIMQAKVPKKQTGPNSSLAWVQQQVTDRQTIHHTSVISTSLDLLCRLVVLRRRRGSCSDLVRKYITWSVQLPDSVAEASKSTIHIQGHGHTRALRNVLGMCFQLNFYNCFILRRTRLLMDEM